MAIERFGDRSQVKVLEERLARALAASGPTPAVAFDGTADGKVKRQPEPDGGTFQTQPLFVAAQAALAVGLSRDDEDTRIGRFLAAAEARGPVTTLKKPAHVSASDWNVFRAEKAIACLAFQRDPQGVTEKMVQARGSVDGMPIEPRDIFTQTFAPLGHANGKTAVIAPGFLESGRTYLDQIDVLCRQGFEVVVMDQQWAGLSSGKAGKIDDGAGIARDVGSVAADVASTRPGRPIVVVGTSMGGGAGAAGAVQMNDNGRLQLDGPQMPKGLDVILQSPYFAASPSFLNDALGVIGGVYGVKDVALFGVGPVLSRDVITLRNIAEDAVLHQTKGAGQAFHASDRFLARMNELAAAGERPRGNVFILHSNADTLARYDATVAYAERIGAHVRTVDSTSHVYALNPKERELVLEGFAWLARPRTH
jgi:alpha-beta hydrolase superfamily lysophospholipase